MKNLDKKVLFCATIDGHFSAFHLPYMEFFQNRGYQVHVAASGSSVLPFCDRKFDIPIARSPFKPQNIRAYRMLKKLILENQYEIIHCHTPMGGVLARLAAKKARKTGTKVIYTAHGFHFYKGAPRKSWLLYYPIEKFLAPRTDCLITINTEDYHFAQTRLKAGRIEHVNGVGVNSIKFYPADSRRRQRLREEYGYSNESVLMVYAAEFNRNKNHAFLIRALSMMKSTRDVRLLLAGSGALLEKCRALANELGVGGRVDFLGRRVDLDSILPMCDFVAASSLREGLPVNIMEAMACGLPVLAADNRGHRDLVAQDENGWLIPSGEPETLAVYMDRLADDGDLRLQMGQNSLRLVQPFTLNAVMEKMKDIYEDFMK